MSQANTMQHPYNIMMYMYIDVTDKYYAAPIQYNDVHVYDVTDNIHYYDVY